MNMLVNKRREVMNLLRIQTQLKLWHERYGHLNERDLKLMIKRDAILDKRLLGEQLPSCEICLKEKMASIPYPKKKERVTNLLEIIHSDICGPMSTISNGKARFFITFIDDSTKFCHVKFLKRKSDAFSAFLSYKNEVERQTNKKIKCIQSDNGTEFCNKEFNNYLAKEGIVRRLTAPYSPQQNGVAERYNRTLVEMARCLLREYNTPPSFWAEAVNTACYIRNRCPTGADRETPYKRWTGKNPFVKYFKKFGCKAFMLDKSQKKGKFESRSEECIFLGYAEESKAYRLWVKSKKLTRISRDVKFIENVGSPGEIKNEIIENIQIYEDKINEIKGPEKEEQQISEDDNKVTVDEQSKNDDDKNGNLNSQTNEKSNKNNEDDVLNNESCKNSKRKRGRPMKVKTGRRGRPRKVYCEESTSEEDEESTNVEDNLSDNLEYTVFEECANMAGMKLKNIFNNSNSPWKNATLEEFESLINNNSWTLIDPPPNAKIIDSKLVLKEKLDEKGNLYKRKARLVARGFSQVHGIDYHDTYSPVVRLTSLRTLMGIATVKGLSIRQLDIKTAFLNGELDEKIYMEPPEDLDLVLNEIIMKSANPILKQKAADMLSNYKEGKKTCLLNKAIYGLKQAGRQWYAKLHHTLLEANLEPLKSDPCVYTLGKNSDATVYLAIYVDDLILFSDKEDLVEKLVAVLREKFEVKDFGGIKYCLGLEFQCADNEIFINQESYIMEILKKYNMEEAKPVDTPLIPNCILEKCESPDLAEMAKYPYQSLIGSLMYLSLGTRPDITYAVNYLSQFNTNYTEIHWRAAKRILRYLKGTAGHGIKFCGGNLNLKGFVDADWANDIENRKSYTGFVYTLAGGPISWEARKQRIVALSSTEAEYVGITEATKEGIWLNRLLTELGHRQEPITLYNDSQSAQKLASNEGYHSRTKHIATKYHFVRQAVEEGYILLKYLRTENMIADVMTKSLPKAKHQSCVHGIGVCTQSTHVDTKGKC